jgi:hypothetical protein
VVSFPTARTITGRPVITLRNLTISPITEIRIGIIGMTKLIVKMVAVLEDPTTQITEVRRVAMLEAMAQTVIKVSIRVAVTLLINRIIEIEVGRKGVDGKMGVTFLTIVPTIKREMAQRMGAIRKNFTA